MSVSLDNKFASLYIDEDGAVGPEPATLNAPLGSSEVTKDEDRTASSHTKRRGPPPSKSNRPSKHESDKKSGSNVSRKDPGKRQGQGGRNWGGVGDEIDATADDAEIDRAGRGSGYSGPRAPRQAGDEEEAAEESEDDGISYEEFQKAQGANSLDRKIRVREVDDNDDLPSGEELVLEDEIGHSEELFAFADAGTGKKARGKKKQRAHDAKSLAEVLDKVGPGEVSSFGGRRGGGGDRGGGFRGRGGFRGDRGGFRGGDRGSRGGGRGRGGFRGGDRDSRGPRGPRPAPAGGDDTTAEVAAVGPVPTDAPAGDEVQQQQQRGGGFQQRRPRKNREASAGGDDAGADGFQPRREGRGNGRGRGGRGGGERGAFRGGRGEGRGRGGRGGSRGGGRGGSRGGRGGFDNARGGGRTGGYDAAPRRGAGPLDISDNSSFPSL